MHEFGKKNIKDNAIYLVIDELFFLGITSIDKIRVV